MDFCNNFTKGYLGHDNPKFKSPTWQYTVKQTVHHFDLINRFPPVYRELLDKTQPRSFMPPPPKKRAKRGKNIFKTDRKKTKANGRKGKREKGN